MIKSEAIYLHISSYYYIIARLSGILKNTTASTVKITRTITVYFYTEFGKLKISESVINNLNVVLCRELITVMQVLVSSDKQITYSHLGL